MIVKWLTKSNNNIDYVSLDSACCQHRPAASGALGSRRISNVLVAVGQRLSAALASRFSHMTCFHELPRWLLSQVQGSGASGGGLALYQVAVSTILDSAFDENYADTGGGGLDATGFNDSTLLVQGTRYGFRVTI